MSKKDNIYLIGAASYEDTVEQRLTLYSYIRQLAFLAKHMKTAEDYIHLKRRLPPTGTRRRNCSPPGISPAATWSMATPATWTPSGRRSSWTMGRTTGTILQKMT